MAAQRNFDLKSCKIVRIRLSLMRQVEPVLTDHHQHNCRGPNERLQLRAVVIASTEGRDVDKDMLLAKTRGDTFVDTSSDVGAVFMAIRDEDGGHRSLHTILPAAHAGVTR